MSFLKKSISPFAHSILKKTASKEISKYVLIVFIQSDWGVLLILVVNEKKNTLSLEKYLLRVFEKNQWGATSIASSFHFQNWRKIGLLKKFQERKTKIYWRVDGGDDQNEIWKSKLQTDAFTIKCPQIFGLQG